MGDRMHTARIALHCLGTFELTIDATAVTAFPTDKIRALLAYLALEQDNRAGARLHRREILAGLLWPEMADDMALANLRLAIHRLRQTLDRAAAGTGAALLTSTRQTVQLNPATLAVDVTRFQALLAESAAHEHHDLPGCDACLTKLAQAVELYQGELLAGFGLADAPAFEEWLLLRREMLHQQALIALHSLAAAWEQRGDYDQAHLYASRQLALDPYREEAHRQLMWILALRGLRGAALVQYERCRQLLADELGVEPDTATTALYLQIRDSKLGPAPGGRAALARERIPSAAPASTQEASPSNLPSPLTSLIGREGELARIDGLLRGNGTRLATIVGAGGAGKTRLALAAAWALRDAFADGVWWVPLAGIATAGLPTQYDALATAVGVAIGRPFEGRNMPLDELRSYLQERAMLLVLDNCEHLLIVAPFVRQLLEAAPRLRVLATSRVVLDTANEVVMRLEGLPLPEPSANDPASYAAVQLFLERARRQTRDFDDSPAALAAIVRLCRLLDGLPLGIELAARWVSHYTYDEIAQEIQADLNFLSVDSADIPERQRGLRAVFDYSWRLLVPAERQTLARLSVFRGSFDRAAAQEVATTRATTLAALVDASLLRSLGVGRYSLHELVRQFAAERLAQSAETELLAERHAAYYLDLMSRQESALFGDTPQAAATIIRAVAENLHPAWIWAVAHNAWDRIARSLLALRQYARIDGRFYEFASLVAAASERLGAQIAAGENVPGRMMLLGRLRGTEAYFLERQEARAAAAATAHAAIACAAAAGDAIGEAYAYLQLSTATVPYIAALAPREALPAIGWLERAISLCRQPAGGAPLEQRFAAEVEAECLLKLSTIRIELREYAAACALAEQALALTRRSGDRMQQARALSISAMALENAGRFEASYERRLVMLDLARANGSRPQEHIALNNLSCTAIYLGDYPGALEYAQAALRIWGEWMQNPYQDADSYHTLSWAACRAGATELALDAAERALASAQASRIPQNLTLPLLALGDALYDVERHAEASAAYSAALALGREREMPSLIAVALAGVARCQLAEGKDAEARAAVDELLGSVDVLTLGCLWEPLRVAEICYRVLQAGGDARATGLLRDAAALLGLQANQIADATRRRVFREQVAAHRTILEAAGAYEITGRERPARQPPV